VRRGWRFSIKYDPAQPRVPAGSAEGGRWTSEGGVLEYVGEIEDDFWSQKQQVERLAGDHFDVAGTGICGPASAAALEKLRRDGYDARPAYADYQFGKGEWDTGAHYFVAVYEDDGSGPAFFVDNNNLFRGDAQVVVLPGDEQWKRFKNVNVGGKDERMQDFVDPFVWTKADFDWWQRNLG